MAAVAETNFDDSVWGGLALRGIVAILFGVLALTKTGGTIAGLVYLFGAFAFVDGVFAVVSSISVVAQFGGRWWAMMLVGLAGIAIGVIAFERPGSTALALTYLIAIWAVVTGLFEIGAAIRLRQVVQGEWLLAVAGVLSIAFGILIGTRPGAGIVSIVWAIGIYAIMLGFLELGLAFRLSSVQRRLAAA
jgi:uncharacterized membrane protein HdeD (DUF308 family)